VIAIPLFVFMGYLVERAALIDRLFKSFASGDCEVPGRRSGDHRHLRDLRHGDRHRRAVVTLMGCSRFPAMLKADTTPGGSRRGHRGGCLGILIPAVVL